MTNTKSRRTDSHDHDSPPGGSAGVDVLTRDEIKTQKPPLYKVFILNDDFTPMDFVIEVLETIFNKTHEEATRIMLLVHRKGVGLCGVYPFDSAETKVAQVLAASRAAEHPLRATMEKE